MGNHFCLVGNSSAGLVKESHPENRAHFGAGGAVNSTETTSLCLTLKMGDPFVSALIRSKRIEAGSAVLEEGALSKPLLDQKVPPFSKGHQKEPI